MTIHSSGQTSFSFSRVEGITLGAGEEVDEVVGGASRTGCWGAWDWFYSRFSVGARDRIRGPGSRLVLTS